MFRASHIQYEHSDRVRGLATGGIGAMHRLAQHTGLVAALDRHVTLLKVHLSLAGIARTTGMGASSATAWRSAGSRCKTAPSSATFRRNHAFAQVLVIRPDGGRSSACPYEPAANTGLQVAAEEHGPSATCGYPPACDTNCREHCRSFGRAGSAVKRPTSAKTRRTGTADHFVSHIVWAGIACGTAGLAGWRPVDDCVRFAARVSRHLLCHLPQRPVTHGWTLARRARRDRVERCEP